MIVSVEESDILNDLVRQMAAMVAREDQRREDRIKSDQLRAQLRKADEKRWDGMEERQNRIQADVTNLRAQLETLPRLVDSRVQEAAERTTDIAKQQAAAVAAKTEQVADDLRRTAEDTAEKLKTATAMVAKVKANDDRAAGERRALSAGTKSVVSLLLCAAIVIAAVVVFTDRDSTAQSLLILAAVCSPAVAVIALVWQKRR